MLLFISGLFLDSNRMLHGFESVLLFLINVTVGPDGNLTHGWKSRGHQSYNAAWLDRLSQFFFGVPLCGIRQCEHSTKEREGKAGH